MPSRSESQSVKFALRPAIFELHATLGQVHWMICVHWMISNYLEHYNVKVIYYVCVATVVGVTEFQISILFCSKTVVFESRAILRQVQPMRPILPSQSLVAPTESLLCGSHNELWRPEWWDPNIEHYKVKDTQKVLLVPSSPKYHSASLYD